MTKRRVLLFALVWAALLTAYWQLWPKAIPDWTPQEIETLRSLSLASLEDLPPDPSNAVADNPLAAEFGSLLFSEPRLSANGGISCATCHQPVRRFTDGLPKGQAIGTTDRNTPSLVGVAYSPWQFWDGRRDSLWAQALAPLEDEREHALDRSEVVAIVAGDEKYRKFYEDLFGDLPDSKAADTKAMNTAFANVGKAIAAFERTLMPGESRFDRYVAALANGDVDRSQELFDDDEIRGLRLFIGDANCTQCHNGPLFTNHEFHNTGVISYPGDVPDKGRVTGVREVMRDEFNCKGGYSDDAERSCGELEFARTDATLIGAFKTPSLRNLENTAPFMHKGQFQTIAEVLQHYNIAADAMIGHNEAKPLGLSGHELDHLEAFLATLAAPYKAYSSSD
jgi:cytochrome c peroxidase